MAAGPLVVRWPPAATEININPMTTSLIPNPRPAPPILRGALLIALLGGAICQGAQTGPFSTSDWPPTVNPSAPVDYGIFDPSASFTAEAGWNNTVSQAGGGDQTYQTITIAGLTGNQQTGNYLNIADSNFSQWTNNPVLDILLQVFGNGAFYNADGSPINTGWLEGTLGSPANNILTVNAGPTPLGEENSQWNWLLLEIPNPVSSVTGEPYVGCPAPGAPGGSGDGGVNGGTLRVQNVAGVILRAIAIGPQGAFGTSNQVNVFAAPPPCPAEPAVNLAFIDLNAGLTNNLSILNNGAQTVTYQNSVGPAGDKRKAVQANSTYMNFGILNDYLGSPCNLPRTMKVCVEFYDDPALAGASFGPEEYATDTLGDTGTYSGPMFTLQGSGQWLRVAFFVPNVDLAGINTAPLTGGPRLTFTGGFPFIDRAELGIFRTGTNALANLDPDPSFYLDPNICTTNYGNYAELDLQNGITNGIGVGSSGGDQLMAVEMAGPPGDQRLSERPDGGDNYLQFAILNPVFGPTYQDNARVAQVLTYYDDPAMVGATFYPQVYSSWVMGSTAYAFCNENQTSVTLTGSGKWLNAYFEIPNATFGGCNQGPQSLVRYFTTPAVAGDPTTGYIHVTRVQYAVIRPCGPYAGVNVLETNKPIAEYGDTVNGYQDDFSGATMNPNWVPQGAGGDRYLQANGLLEVFANHGDPNHLLYAAPGYSNSVQEVLARMRVVAFQQGDYFRGGIGVCVGTNASSGTNYEAINLHFRDQTNEVAVRHMKLLDDARAWGPTNYTNDWSNNTWYWLRLRQQSKMDGTNTVFAKVWPADWTTPEPANWQLLWADSALPSPHHVGLAGITAASGDALAQLEVSYVLIKAAGLPNVTVTPVATVLPPMQAPFFLAPVTPYYYLAPDGSGKTAPGADITWFGVGTLYASPNLTGPYTNAVSTTNGYAIPKAKLNPLEFYMVQ